MHEGEGRLVGAGGIRLGQQRLEAIGRELGRIQLVSQLGQDLRAFVGKVLIDDVPGLRLAVHDTGRALIPVFTLLPGCPASLGIKAVQLVRAAAYIRIEGELNRVLLLLEDVLGEDPGAAPAVEEGGVEARVGLLEIESDRVVIDRGH